jgi:hypothetical protein
MSQKQNETQNAPLISLLINSAYFFIDCVYILFQDGLFRLTAIHNRIVLKDSCYRTVKGARIAFVKQFKHKFWTDEVKAEWTDFYNPDEKWIEDKAVNAAGRRVTGVHAHSLPPCV